MSRKFSTRLSKSVKATSRRLAKMGDKDIDVSDIPPLGPDFWKGAKLAMPKAKTAIALRVDAEILDWFKRQGPGYQTRMNAVLKAYVQSHDKRSRHK